MGSNNNNGRQIKSNLTKKNNSGIIEKPNEEEVTRGILSSLPTFSSIFSNITTKTTNVIDIIEDDEDIPLKNFEKRYGCSDSTIQNDIKNNGEGDNDDDDDRTYRLYNYLEQQYEEEQNNNILLLYYKGKKINQLYVATFISITLSILLHFLNISIVYHYNTMADPSTIRYKNEPNEQRQKEQHDFGNDFTLAMKAIDMISPPVAPTLKNENNSTSEDPSTNTTKTTETETENVNQLPVDILDNNDPNSLKEKKSNLYSIEEISGHYLSTTKNRLNEKRVIAGATMINMPAIPMLSDPKNNTIPEFDHLKDTWETHSPSDHVIFLHFPKTGGTTIKNILGVCYRKVLASEAGIKGHANDKELSVVKGYGDSLFVNIDSTTSEGIQRAYDMGFADAHLADLTVTPFLYIIDTLFKPTSKGRVLSMFRQPIERAVSMLNYVKYAEWEPSYIDEFKSMTLEEYAKSPYVENNFYTRVLSNTMEGSITDDHFAIATYNLKKKVVVGLLDKLDESLGRFEAFFGWKYSFNPTEQEKCRQGYLTNGANTAKRKTINVPDVGSDQYELLAWQNQYDLKLYDTVIQLFNEQKYLVSDKPYEYRLVDTTCSECLEKQQRQQEQYEKENDINPLDFDLDAKPDALTWFNA